MVATDEISSWRKQICADEPRIQLQNKDFFEPITKNKVANFSPLRNKIKMKKDEKVTTLDIDRKIFSKLIVVSQTRDFDLKKLFEYELSNVPLALFNPDGSMRTCTKSEIERSLSVKELDDIDGLSAVIIDFMVLLRMVCTDTAKRKSFGELSDMIFRMYRVASRIDVVCDRYDMEDSIKPAERTRRRMFHTQEIQVQSTNTPLPKQRIKMSNPRNKENIADWIDKGKTKLRESQKLVLAGGFRNGRESIILTRDSASIAFDLPSEHEEAGSRIFVHVKHAKVVDNAKRVIIWSPDIDVAIICPRTVKELNIQQLFFMTGTKQRKRLIPMHAILDNLGDDIFIALPNLHVLTGCDSNSALSGHGKKSILKLAQSNLTVVSRLNDNFGIDPTTISEEAIEICLELASLIYTGKESNMDLAKMWKDLFEKKQLVSDKLPPTFPEYHEHIKRAHFQPYNWNNATVPMLNLPSPIARYLAHREWMDSR